MYVIYRPQGGLEKWHGGGREGGSVVSLKVLAEGTTGWSTNGDQPNTRVRLILHGTGVRYAMEHPKRHVRGFSRKKKCVMLCLMPHTRNITKAQPFEISLHGTYKKFKKNRLDDHKFWFAYFVKYLR